MVPNYAFWDCFHRWTAGAALAVPLSIVEHDETTMLLRFAGIEVVEVWVHRGSVTVAALADGECIDLLACFEAFPEELSAGFVCVMCDPAMRDVYPDAEALWREHLFQPFEKWVSAELAPATRLGIGGDEGASWAVLLTDDEDRGYRRIVPLWLAPGGPGSPGGD